MIEVGLVWFDFVSIYVVWFRLDWLWLEDFVEFFGFF